MIEIPQLRVRTEFSFKTAFGPVARVAEALKEIGSPAAGIVDADTWGHVRYAAALEKEGIRPLFGSEITVPMLDGRKPVAWALAEDSKAFYRFSSAARDPAADIPKLFADSKGIIRFAGAALTDPACFDYIDLNPGSPLQQRAAMRLHQSTGKPLVITSDNAYPRPSDYAAFMAIINRDRITPQTIMSRRELHAALVDNGPLDDVQFMRAVANTFEASERAISKLEKAPIIQVPGDLRAMVEAGKRYRIDSGHIEHWSGEYQNRLEYELGLIESKKFDSYFIVVADLIQWAKQRMLVGPGRGSSAGSLVCYLLRITEIDPLAFGLLFERFIDVTRKDFPDIDIDFNDQKRDAIFDYLKNKYGIECVARIGNVLTLKPKSLLNSRIMDKFGVPAHEWQHLRDVTPMFELPGSSLYGKAIKHALETTDTGKRFAQTYPQACIVCEAENHASHTGVHAAGVAVANVPIVDFCTVGPDGIAHVDKVDAEELNLLKIDALGLTSLGILEDAGASGEDLYALKPNDPEVFRLFREDRYTGIFQFDGKTTQNISSKLHINDFGLVVHIMALSRPGPKDGGATDVYIKRANGAEPLEYEHPSLEPILKPTQGIILYQEQVMRICREIAGFEWEDVMDIRRAIGKKKGNEYFNQRRAQFVAGALATVGMPPTVANSVWEQMLTFGTYGFNQAHSVSYGLLSYWCAWMKRYRPLSFYASCLRRASDESEISALLREAQETDKIDFVAFDIRNSDVEWKVDRGALLGGWTNIFGVGPATAIKYINKRNTGTLTREDVEKIMAKPLRFAELYPLKRDYRDWYRDPAAMGCRDDTVILTSNEFPEGGGSYRYWPEVVWLARVTGKRTRDENEQRLVTRRGGEIKSGQTKFADIMCADDYQVEFACRIKAAFFEPLGRMALENLKIGDVVLVRGRKCPGYNIIHVDRYGMKCLTNGDALNTDLAGVLKTSEGIEVLPPGEGPKAQPLEIE
jgi:DNA polymerase III alpha subunit